VTFSEFATITLSGLSGTVLGGMIASDRIPPIIRACAISLFLAAGVAFTVHASQ
jgi:hypothetical protein